MTVQHADIFHCLVCGRMLYEPHGNLAPDCCGQPMVRTVADIVENVSPHPAEQPADLEEHALLAEAADLSNWCRAVVDVDIARYDELRQRLQALRRVLADRFEDPEHARSILERDGAAEAALRAERRQLLASLDRLAADLSDGELSPPWAQVCDRLDTMIGDLRHSESESARQASHADRTVGR